MFTLQGLRSPQRMKWLFKTVIFVGFGLLIISFVFFYGWHNDGTTAQNPEFARVRSESILPWKRWTSIRREQMTEGQQRAAQAKMAVLPGQYRQFLQQQGMNLNGLITHDEIAREAANSVLVRREVEAEKVHVDQAEILKMFAAQPGITNEVLENIARSNGFPNAFALVEAQRRSEEENRLKSVVGSVAHASLFELWQEYAISHETLDVQVAGYPAESFTQNVTVTEPELQQYLDDNHSKFEIPAQRRYAYVAYTKAEAEQGVTATEDELRAYYEQHQTDYMQQPGRKAIEIMAPLVEDRSSTDVAAVLSGVRERAKADADWTSLATQLDAEHPGMSFYPNVSQMLEPESATRPAEYMAELNKLELGAVSEPIITEKAVYMIKLLEERKQEARAFEDVRAQVETDFKSAKATERYDEVYTRFEAEKSKHDNIRSLSQALGIQDQLTSMVAQLDTSIPGVGSFAEYSAYMTELPVNEISDPMKTAQAIATVQVVDQVPAHVPTLAEARDTVEQAYRLEHARDLARQAAEQAERLIASGADFKSALADAPKPPFEATGITRLQPISGLSAPLIGFRQQTLKAKQGSYGLSPYGQDAKAPQGYAVWRVTALKPAQQADFTKERADFERDYVALQRETIIREWLKDLRNDAQFQIVEQK